MPGGPSDAPHHAPSTEYRIAPSDLTFLLFGCFRCFYNKIINSDRQPVSIPRVFTTMDRQQREFFEGKPIGDLAVGLGPGTITCPDTPLQSAPVVLRHRTTSVFFRGALDARLEFDDGTCGIVDFKTTHPADSHVGQYTLQLHAYAQALEHPADGTPGVTVTALGLLCFEPAGLTRGNDGGLCYRTEPTWIAVERDDVGFLAILDIVASILELPEPPTASERCQWCRYRTRR